jgi:TRAP-type C4-dicarboxylate transport system permease small subunit
VAQLTHGLSLIPRIAALILMLILLVDMMLGVFFRYVVGRALSWSEEVGTLSLVWLTFIGGAIGVNRGAHFAIHLAIDRLSPSGQKAAHIFVDLLVAFLGIVLTYGGWRLMESNATSETPSLGLSLSVMYAPAFVGGLLIIVYAIAHIRDVLRERVQVHHA